MHREFGQQSGSLGVLLCCRSIASNMSEQAPKQSAVRKGLFDVLTYAWKHQTYVDALRTDTQNLKARLSDVQREVEDARSSYQDIKPQVVKWLDDGNKELKVIDTFLGSLCPTASCWKFGCDCNCKRRYTLATRAKSHSKEINMLMERCSFEGGVSPPLTPTLGSAYKALPSREKYLERIMEALLGSDKLVIGLYGAKGVGKTMLVKKLVLAIESGGMFNVVAITTGNWGEKFMGYMQVEMGQRIGLILTKDSELDNARWLSNTLKSMGKVLIIVDSLEKKLDLNKIGIPWPENNNDCRIVVVSRSLDACKEMKTHMNLEIEPLCQEEALQLFDELTKEYNFADTTKIQQARDGLLSKFLWTPGEIKKLIQPFQHKLLPPESIIIPDGSAKTTLMLGAEALTLMYTEDPQNMRWLTPSPSTSSLKVAEIILVWSLMITKEVREEWLSPATNYGAYFVYQLIPHAVGFNATPIAVRVANSKKSCYLDPLAAASKASEGVAMPKRRKDGWLEIEVGNFFNVGRSSSVVNLLLHWSAGIINMSGLLIQGIELRPLV